MVELYLTGIHPRSEALVAATRGLDRGRVSPEEVEEVRRKDTEDLVALQQEARCDYVLDGLLNWQDLFRPFVEGWKGLEAGPLTRWFDNNTFFRQPIVSGPVEGTRLPDPFFRTDLLPSGAAWKAVLPGPHTFAEMAEDRHYGDGREALLAIAEALAVVAGDLRERGARLLQFQEPSLAVRPPGEDDGEGLREAYRLLTNGGPTAVHLFFGPFQPVADVLAELPVDVVGVDLYEEDRKALAGAGLGKKVGLGCLDARNSLLEDPGEVAALAVEVAEDLEAPGVILAPNADLEFLPRTVADAKVRILGQAKEKAGEVL